MRRITIPLIVMGVSGLAGVTFAAEDPPPDVKSWPSWHGHTHGFWWIFPLMMMFMFFFFVLYGNRGGWWRLRQWRGEYPESWQTYKGDRDATPESALDILDKRYARGEIDKEEYLEKRATIMSSNNDDSDAQHTEGGTT